MNLEIPAMSLVVLLGASGSGKSTFARRHFKPTEIVSSDFCRGIVSDDENDQTCSEAAFEVLRQIVRQRLKAGRLTVVDATNVQTEARKPLLALAREFHVLPTAIALALPDSVCLERNKSRPDRQFGPHVVRRQSMGLRTSLRGLEREGFRHLHVLRSLEEIEAAQIVRVPLWNDRRHETGPFDFIGDVHGCLPELRDLLARLGYVVDEANPGPVGPRLVPPAGRKLVFVGDLVDRGPDTPGVLRLVMQAVADGHALCVAGNHDVKLARKLRGRDVKLTHGLAESVAQLATQPAAFSTQVADFLEGLIAHYVLDGGRLVVAHAGLKEEMHGRASGAIREFALYGDVTGEQDELGLPIRNNWAAEYRGRARVIYGHTPVALPEWLNNAINLDTGCVFGGHLTALRYPELELVSVPAHATYTTPGRPFLPDPNAASTRSAQQAHDDVLDLSDVIGRRIITTRLLPGVTIRADESNAALEAISRFAVDPRWLVHLPPTMSPPETSSLPGLLEHPAEAFAYFRSEGITEVVCEEKHMGSRAIVIVCRDADAARKAFGISDGSAGIVYTRTGRRFFDDSLLEAQLLEHVRAAFSRAGLWDELNTAWAILDTELMPWSAKAQSLIQSQYATVGAAATTSLARAREWVAQAAARRPDAPEPAALLASLEARSRAAVDYRTAYRHYCWPVRSFADLRLAPFHLLASEGAVHADKPHAWHLATLARLADPILLATRHRFFDLNAPESEAGAVQWWEQLTTAGGEGMVVKPAGFTVRGTRGWIQPAIKCRGREYLRIIYGPEYTLPENLDRLRQRRVAGKRSLALREYALGIEALERFTRREPLRRIHECVFGVLALESEPIDPRL
jgi:protein phosphatase